MPVEGALTHTHPSNFTIMTYNVLADLYATVSITLQSSLLKPLHM